MRLSCGPDEMIHVRSTRPLSAEANPGGRHLTRSRSCRSNFPPSRTHSTHSNPTSTRGPWRSTTASIMPPTWTNANNALAGTEWENALVDDVLRSLSSLPADKQAPVRNNAGGHANHSLFWSIMSPSGGGDPDGALGDAINSTFGSADALREAVTKAGIGQFGSGWAWLVHDGSGLKVYGKPNQDSPDHGRPYAAPRRRRLGARLLPELPEPATRLHRGLVERRRLVGRRRALRGLFVVASRPRSPTRERAEVPPRR